MTYALWCFGECESSLALKVLQNIAKALIDLHHYELAFGYAHAATRLGPQPLKATYLAALAAHRCSAFAAAAELLSEVRLLAICLLCVHTTILPRFDIAALESVWLSDFF